MSDSLQYGKKLVLLQMGRSKVMNCPWSLMSELSSLSTAFLIGLYEFRDFLF
mgnify:CR=1 FL=1